MDKADQLLQDDPAGRFDELVGRRSLSSPSLGGRIMAEMKHRGVEVTEMNAVHLAAILCAAVPTNPAFLVPYSDAFSFEEGFGIGGPALPVDNSVEPAAQPCGGMWVGGPKSWPEWKAVHQQTAPWPRRLLTRLRWRLEISLYTHDSCPEGRAEGEGSFSS